MKTVLLMLPVTLLFMLPVLILLLPWTRGWLVSPVWRSGVSKLTQYSPLGRQRELVPQGPDTSHSEDRALVQPVSLTAAFVFALAAVMAPMVALSVGLPMLARWDLRYHARVAPTFVKQAAPGMSVADCWATVVEEELKTGGEGARPAGVARMQAFTGDVDTDFNNKQAMDLLRGFLAEQVEKDTPAVRLFALELLGGGRDVQVGEDLGEDSESRDTNTDEMRRAVERRLAHSAAPWGMTSHSFDQWLVEHKQIEVKGERVIVQEDNEVKMAFTRGVYTRLVDEAGPYRRVYQLMVGWVQVLTLLAFYFCLALLAGRRWLIQAQEFATLDAFVKGIAQDQDIKDSLDLRKELLVRVPVEDLNADPYTTEMDVRLLTEVDILDANAVEREKGLLMAAMARWSDGERPHPYSPLVPFAPDLLAPSLAYTVLTEMSGHRQSAPGEGLRLEGRRVLDEAVQRAEERLERVEYTAIDYAIYAVPSLGFIGTVLGIGQALGAADLIVRAADKLDQAQAVSAVTRVLGFAFDTTLIALVASLILSAILSKVRARESSLLLNIKQTLTERYFQATGETKSRGSQP